MSGFGNRFKSARESTDLTLEQIAQETRISARFLRAIEEESFQDLPGGLFNRGFIRKYANRLGIDGEQCVSEYKELVREADADEKEAVSKASVGIFEGHVLPIAIGSLIVLLVLFYVFARATGMPTEAASSRVFESAVSASRLMFPPASKLPARRIVALSRTTSISMLSTPTP